jgi:DNA/RNA-binding domain of Phe-tRNA-synthetase-like protein
MTRLIVADEVCAAFPDLRIDVLVADGFSGNAPWPEVEVRLAALESSAAAGAPARDGEDDPHIAAWYSAYRAFGTNPRRERPSVDALRRRLARSGRLPRINPAVDCYNLVSVSFGVPAGAFDLSAAEGDITVRFADGSEPFTPLGEPGKLEYPHLGEVIYTDAIGVLTRHWNHRDADRTKVTADSDRIAFILETVAATPFGTDLDAAANSLSALLVDRSDSLEIHRITAADPAAPLLDFPSSQSAPSTPPDWSLASPSSPPSARRTSSSSAKG